MKGFPMRDFYQSNMRNFQMQFKLSDLPTAQPIKEAPKPVVHVIGYKASEHSPVTSLARFSPKSIQQFIRMGGYYALIYSDGSLELNKKHRA